MGVPARARSTFSTSGINRAKQCLYVVDAVARNEGGVPHWGSGYREIVSWRLTADLCRLVPVPPPALPKAGVYLTCRSHLFY